MSSESTGMLDLMAWLETNKQRLVTLTGVVLVVGFVGFYLNWSQEQSELTASTALAKARFSVQTQTGENATVDPAAFLSVATSYAGTLAGDRSILFAGGAHFERGEYTEAQAQFEVFLRSDEVGVLRGVALYGVAASLDAQGKAEAAETAYDQVVSKHADTYLADQAKLALAGLHERQGQPEKALALYEQLTQINVSATYTAEATTRRAVLLKAHPELVKEPEPAVEEAVSPSAPSTP